MPIALSSIRNLLLPGLWAVTGKYDQLPAVRKQVFKERKSNMALEQSTSMRYIAQAYIKQEGAPTQADNASGQRYTYNQTHNELAVLFAITRKAIDDNLYKTEFGPAVMGLNEAFDRTNEAFAADVFNSATTYQNAIGGDGVALLSTAHPVDGGTFSNLASPAASLNETSLLNAQVAINANFRDNANQRMNAKPRRLVIPPQLEPVAIRLLKTELRPGTANNDVNAILSTQGGIPDGYLVWNYLTSQFAWYLQTNQDGLVYMNRVPYETDMSVEFSTDNLLVKGYQRNSYSYNEPRALYGSNPTS
ncbi:hypothetical protein IC762_12425 [Bradyrhizobium genosp. L]|uniref:phage major capsid protein n=1 Tax=Bradyrhizobium genosp. L TaxID=83637 RepID=UPI0018A29528|nr:hypothetical protein [Bradyrhizobium genosp. L]QPF87048.1 hypothetical protein IC762_12425 [Bradyrhizobium genosp. L]